MMDPLVQSLFIILSVEISCYLRGALLAPVKMYQELQKTGPGASAEEPYSIKIAPTSKSFVENVVRIIPDKMRATQPHALFKRCINWNKVIPNRPALAKIVVEGSIAFSFAVLIGIVAWCMLYSKGEKVKHLGPHLKRYVKKSFFLRQIKKQKDACIGKLMKEKQLEGLTEAEVEEWQMKHELEKDKVEESEESDEEGKAEKMEKKKKKGKGKRHAIKKKLAKIKKAAESEAVQKHVGKIKKAATSKAVRKHVGKIKKVAKSKAVRKHVGKIKKVAKSKTVRKHIGKIKKVTQSEVVQEHLGKLKKAAKSKSIQKHVGRIKKVAKSGQAGKGKKEVESDAIPKPAGKRKKAAKPEPEKEAKPTIDRKSKKGGKKKTKEIEMIMLKEDDDERSHGKEKKLGKRKLKEAAPKLKEKGQRIGKASPQRKAKRKKRWQESDESEDTD
ncbi:hypothetical protein JRQ81_007351 [Phrynocephalus forsythii]|uniref:Axoneme-associated protein mst101(2)-like n=1 Tax=Phrynocephalus forsythii TaxID=171643 RepID=A0A9Q0XDA1_9SAUR|nr:hypothetical protein JRQ81_007351 [Phrynocephalus forsythii]